MTADPFTFIPARDGFVLSSFALRGAVETLEMLRPLANAPVNTKDWWLMHFAHALAEREGARELADQFLAKAESLYVPKRPLEFPTELEGDKADKMLALSTLSEPDRANLWQIVKPPKPDYPSAALNKLESGACAVVFDISPSGATENVRAYCSSKRFLKEAARAIDDVRFESSAENPRPAQGIIYPLEFTIHG
ncbi:MAG: energy transducer TonB [Pseudomonadota bacterium]